MTQKLYNFLDTNLLPQKNSVLQTFVTNISIPQTYNNFIKLVENSTDNFLDLVVPLTHSSSNGLITASLPTLNLQSRDLRLEEIQKSFALVLATGHAHKIIKRVSGKNTASRLTGIKQHAVIS